MNEWVNECECESEWCVRDNIGMGNGYPHELLSSLTHSHVRPERCLFVTVIYPFLGPIRRKGPTYPLTQHSLKQYSLTHHITILLTHSLIIFCSLPSNNESDTYVQICGVDTTQSQLFESVEDVIDSVMEGFNGTILAYGQTSSG